METMGTMGTTALALRRGLSQLHPPLQGRAAEEEVVVGSMVPLQ